MLRSVDPSASVLERVLPAIAQLLDSQHAYAYSLGARKDRIEVDQLVGLGGSISDARRHFDALLAEQRPDWTIYNPLRPEPAQRNRAIDTVRLLGWDGVRKLPVWRRVFQPLGFGEHDQLRALVCEGQSLLAHVAGIRVGALYTDRERQLLQALVPDLRRALTLERQLRDAPFAHAALEAALEAVPGEAYVVDPGGLVAHANAAGKARLDSHRAETQALLGRCAKGTTREAEAMKLAGGGLLVVRRNLSDRDARVETARRRFALTPRQTEVLRELARGQSNAEIAAALGCSPATVEVHLRALYEKLDCDTRAAVLAVLLDL